MDTNIIKSSVQKYYGEIARASGSCCTPATSTGFCCGDTGAYSESLGYAPEDMSAAPSESNLGLGCGNPQAIANLRAGEVVLDLGSGAGFDCFLAAKRVGDSGKVIGVDMTPEMITRARTNAKNGKYKNVEFRLGEIESLPVADASVDIIISNCVINLSPDKPKVFREAFRVLKLGGRLAISDIVACIPLPKEIRDDAALISGCIGGAATMEELAEMIRAAGFERVQILPKAESRKFIKDWVEGMNIEDLVVSATIEARKAKG